MDNGNRITSIDAGTYFNHAIVRGRNKPDTKLVRVVVDSRERNHVLFENPNNYEVAFPEPIHHVTFVKLIAACIPFASYIVNQNNNAIHFTAGGLSSVANVAVGDYEDGPGLATAVQDALNAKSANGAFVVDYIALTDNFALTCSTPFSLDFRSAQIVTRGNNPDFIFPPGSIAPMLGFAPKTYASSLDPTTGSSSVASEFRKNMEVDDALVIHIDLMELNKSTMDAFDGSFAIVHRGEAYNTFDDFFYSKYFYPPVRISKVRVRITDSNGHPYDFQNQDHRFEFLFESNIKNVS